MKWVAVVREEKIVVNKSEIDFEMFRFLTGKNIDFSKRLNKRIIITKENGHIYINDFQFIKDEVYSMTMPNFMIGSKTDKTQHIYKCVEIDNDNNVLLSPITDSFGTLNVPNDAHSWTVYSKGKK